MHHYHQHHGHRLSSICNPVLTFLLICEILDYDLFQIDMEKLAGFLSLHLMAVLMSSDKDETLFRYLLSGIRLLHSLCDLAPRHAKLEQVPILILAEDLKNFIFFLILFFFIMALLLLILCLFLMC